MSRHSLEHKYILWERHYIHLNPLRARLVNKPGDWRWSSFRFYCGIEESSFLDKEIINAYYGSPQGYRDLMNEKIENNQEKISKYLIKGNVK